MSMTPKYPHIIVQLSGTDGNAFAVLGRVDRALAAAGCDEAERAAFRYEATNHTYDHLLRTVMRWVEVK